MNNKWSLILSVFQIVIGVLAIAAFIVAGLSGENMIKWTITLILAIAFVILGVIGITGYKSNR